MMCISLSSFGNLAEIPAVQCVWALQPHPPSRHVRERDVRRPSDLRLPCAFGQWQALSTPCNAACTWTAAYPTPTVVGDRRGTVYVKAMAASCIPPAIRRRQHVVPHAVYYATSRRARFACRHLAVVVDLQTLHGSNVWSLIFSKPATILSAHMRYSRHQYIL